MRPPTASLIPLCLTLTIGCGAGSGPAVDPPEIGPPRPGTDAAPTKTDPGAAVLPDTGPTPDAPIVAGDSAADDEELGPIRIVPPRELQDRADPAPATGLPDPEAPPDPDRPGPDQP